MNFNLISQSDLTEAHIEAEMQINRRNQLEALSRTLDSLIQCWSDLYENSLVGESIVVVSSSRKLSANPTAPLSSTKNFQLELFWRIKTYF